MSITPYAEPQTLAVAESAQSLVHWAQSADAAYSLAQKLVSTSFCPQQFRGKPQEAAAAMLAGAEVGLSPMAALRSFDVIQGTAAPRALTLRAVAQSHGAEFVTVEEGPDKVVMRGRRTGSGEWETVTWTIKRAQQMGLTGKDNWKKQPQSMLVARATSDLARRIAADAILGIGYSAEELEDEAASTTTVKRGTGATSKVSRKTEPEFDNPPSAEHAAAAEADETPAPDAITSAQQKKMGALMREADMSERDVALAFVNQVIGREITSRNELSKAEAGQVIDALEHVVAEPPADPERLTDAEFAAAAEVGREG